MGNPQRERQKARKKQAREREEHLNNLDCFGNRDRTPQEAVQNIIEKERRS